VRALGPLLGHVAAAVGAGAMPRRCPASDATFHAIDWSPRANLLPSVLLAVSAGRAAHGYLIEEYLTQQ
jgi:hypothetical protein